MLKKIATGILSPLFFLVACAAEPLHNINAARQMIDVPNFLPTQPPCRLSVPPEPMRCIDNTCVMPALPGAKLDKVTLTFSCIPLTSPTGFENPSATTRVQVLKVQNASGHLSVTDDIDGMTDEPVREVSFCITGRGAYVCGSAKTLHLSDSKKLDAAPTVIRFIKGIEIR